MSLIPAGADAPPIDGVDLGSRPRVLWFYKVTCPVCQMVAPVADRLASAYPGHVMGLGQDPDDRLSTFGATFGATFEAISDAPRYSVSERYGIEVVPTLVVVDGGRVLDVVESWDREGYNRASARLAERTGRDPIQASSTEDGLPSFRPG
jgi:thiol-disulfide isomerase/thioredoxin